MKLLLQLLAVVLAMAAVGGAPIVAIAWAITYGPWWLTLIGLAIAALALVITLERT